VLTGAGKTLSAGGDVDQIRYIIDNPRVFYAAMVNARRIIGNILDCPKPIIFHRAMINPLFTPKRMAEMEHSVQYREVYAFRVSSSWKNNSSMLASANCAAR